MHYITGAVQISLGKVSRPCGLTALSSCCWKPKPEFEVWEICKLMHKMHIPLHFTFKCDEKTRTVLLTLLAVASLFVVGGDAPLDFEVGGRLAVELAVGSRFGKRQVAAGGRLAGLQL